MANFGLGPPWPQKSIQVEIRIAFTLWPRWAKAKLGQKGSGPVVAKMGQKFFCTVIGKLSLKFVYFFIFFNFMAKLSLKVVYLLLFLNLKFYKKIFYENNLACM